MRLWKPIGAGVYTSIFIGRTQMPLLGPIHLWYLSIPLQEYIRPCGLNLVQFLYACHLEVYTGTIMRARLRR